ncbi:hypothetical protein C8R43DRAFT_1116230 [Mycena crocata]|nr:hypothetical protein C8R43DRAFT_1116230 [Mycena crocata]
MNVLAAVLSPFNLGQFLPHAAAPSSGNRRKSRHPKGFKVTPLQRYTRVSRSESSSHSSSSYSSRGTSCSSTSTAASAPAPPPFGFFEPEMEGGAPVEENMRAQMEVAKIRYRAHRGGGPIQQNAFAPPQVLSWVERQRLRDRINLRRSLPPLPISSPSSIANPPPPAHRPSYIVQRWHGLKKEVEALREDRRVYAQIRGEDSAAATPWNEYQKRWTVALGKRDSPLLSFTDIPWPVTHVPHNGSHITAVDVQQFLLCTTRTVPPPYAIHRITEEIQRWRTDRFTVHILPRVVPYERESVAAAAEAVLDILLEARRDIQSYEVKRHTAP